MRKGLTAADHKEIGDQAAALVCHLIHSRIRPMSSRWSAQKTDGLSKLPAALQRCVCMPPPHTASSGQARQTGEVGCCAAWYDSNSGDKTTSCSACLSTDHV